MSCGASTRAKLRTLRRLYPAARDVEHGGTVLYDATTTQFPASTTLVTTPGMTPSLSFEVPEHMVGLVEFATSGRLRGQSTAVLPGGTDPTAWLGAPLLLTVYKVFVAVPGPNIDLPTFAPGVVTLDPAFTPVSQVVPRVWYQPSQSNAGPLYQHQTVHANTVVEVLQTGTYIATLSVQNDGITAGVGSPAYWVTATFGGTNGWQEMAFVSPYSTLTLAEDPPIFQIRATMRYLSGGASGPGQTTVVKKFTYAPPGNGCRTIEVANGSTLPEVLATPCP